MITGFDWNDGKARKNEKHDVSTTESEQVFFNAPLLMLADADNPGKKLELAATQRLPAISELRPFVDAGGLMSYGPNTSHQYERTADYIDKLFKGAKSADLPVEQPTSFALVINRKTARALGLPVPQPFC